MSERYERMSERANERAEERMGRYSMPRFHSHSAHRALISFLLFIVFPLLNYCARWEAGMLGRMFCMEIIPAHSRAPLHCPACSPRTLKHHRPPSTQRGIFAPLHAVLRAHPHPRVHPRVHPRIPSRIPKRRAS